MTWPADALEVGRILDAWGLKGWFRVQPYSQPPEALLGARRWFLKPSERAPSQASTLPSVLEISEVREHGDGLVASSPAAHDRTSAEALRGARIFVARSSFPATAADEYYWADLIGLEVVNREAVTLGHVVGLIETGPQSVLRVQAEAETEAEAGVGTGAAAETLIPFVAAYVDSVDLSGRRIVVDWGPDF